MALNLGAMSSFTVPDSPAVKRQKTAIGYHTSTSNSLAPDGYNSDNDDGDVLFDGYVPDTPKHKHTTQPTQIITKSNAFETQPTQILPIETPPTQIFPKSSAFETQPTQIIDRAPRSSPSWTATPTKIQVPASSPFKDRDSATPNMPMPKPKPVQNAPIRNLASVMAPAGTAYKPPAGILKQPTAPAASKFVIDIADSDEDDAPKFQGGDSDSDEERLARANINPSTFAHRSTESSFGSGLANGNSKFQETMRSSLYKGPARGAQTKPDRARPVDDIDDISDSALYANVTRIRSILPSISVMKARAALLSCKGNFNNAINMLGGEFFDADGGAIEISDDELSVPVPKPAPEMKRGLNAPTVSIRDKYSSTQALPARKTEAPKPRKRLMKGRKNPSSPTSSPMKAASPAASVIELEDETDSGVGTEEEADPELDDRVLKYLNTCKVEELVELTSITKDLADLMVAARPFRNLDAARTVEKPLKSGKKSSRAPIGDKIVDTAVSMFSGYEAIDLLVAKCEELSKPLVQEMSSWGFDVFGASKDGELEMTSLEDDTESLRDSGIGTPASATSPKNDDEINPVASVRKKRGNVTFLKKPEIMAEDCVLKDYQVVGLNWLALMYRRKLSCILADEMGLGKTCQVIAFLAHLVETGNPGPHLVVCPGSTLENWLREIQRFAPQLVAEPYHGPQKERGEMSDQILENRHAINIVVTTYEMASKKEDNKFMKKLRPDVCVYDEGHYLKNVKSQRYQGLIRIPATFRLLLTGTPLQNNLQELAALLAFILPEVFQERAEDLEYIFKAKATTSDKDHAALLSAQRIARARSMLTPFVLRRKKTQVLKHLPSKTCRVEYSTLHSAQKKIYDGHLGQARERARARIEGGKIPKNENEENNPLMQLRKAAIHPLLFRRHFTNEKIEKMADILRKKEPVNFPSDKNNRREHLVAEMRSGSDFWLHQWCYDYPCIKNYCLPDLAWMDSGKVDSMIKLVKSYKENGDRVLIFSQFALVLNILEAVLNTALVSFTRIDGSTKIDERQSLIDNFRDDESITVFLLTTKAGGTGINLMYANKVIIFDGSFNPQDDRQAENRAHRVGQTRDVEVIRLVTKGTVEEQIYALGQSKLVLDGRVAGDDEATATLAGEKLVAKMLLEGTTVEDEPAEGSEERESPVEIEKEGKGSSQTQGKKSTILGSLVIKKGKGKRKSKVERDSDDD